MSYADGRFRIQLDGQEIDAEKLLVAAGRHANLTDIGVPPWIDGRLAIRRPGLGVDVALVHQPELREVLARAGPAVVEQHRLAAVEHR